jgi:hypothetical protein
LPVLLCCVSSSMHDQLAVWSMENSHLRNLKPCVKSFITLSSGYWFFVFEKDLEAYVIAPDFYSWSCMSKLGHFGKHHSDFIIRSTSARYLWNIKYYLDVHTIGWEDFFFLMILMEYIVVEECYKFICW